MLISLLPVFPSPACCRIIHRPLESQAYLRTRLLEPGYRSKKFPEREGWRQCNPGMATDPLRELG